MKRNGSERVAAHLLALEAVRFAWPGHASPTIVIDELTMVRGEKLFLFGPSGSGKSTLLGLIGGLIRPQAGQVSLLGQDFSRWSGARRDRFRAEHLGVIFQQFNLLPWLDVHANVALPCRFSRERARRAGPLEGAVARLLRAVDLDESLWRVRADQLSVGQQQRVASARALIGQPALILADEPTSALDADRRQTFIDLLFAQVEEAGSGLLFVSHDRELARRFDRQLNLPDINSAGGRA
ncbi:MAG: ABC transporter ATP-binding protein [Wenzhouxiangella sp.]|nr:ABC transporter ATP-binding protein [Wenzhouxiangella sp.]